MSSINDIYAGLQDISTAITQKGGTINTANYNPSLLEMKNGVLSIPVTQVVLNAPASNVSNIVVAEVANTTITILNTDGVTIGTETITNAQGGVVLIPVTEVGNYTVTATKDGNEVWSKTFGVTSIGSNFICKPGREASTFSFEDFYNARQGGYSQYLFNLKDYFTFSATGSLFNNLDMFIAHVGIDGGITIKLKKPYTTSKYPMNSKFSYLASATSTSFSNTYSNLGGYKYCHLRQKCMKVGDEVYSQATSIKPVGSTITTGIEFDKIYYTNGNGKTSGVYTFDKTTDTFTQDSEMTYFSSSSAAQSGVKFLKGYFISVGKLTEDVFNSGYYYYTFTSDVYTPATTWSSSTSYYAFYETIQEDGIFLAALSSIRQYLRLKVRYASTGGAQKDYVATYEDYITLDCAENYTGLNRDSTLFAGGSPTASYVNATNNAGEGEKFDSMDSISMYIGSSDYWTRSAYSGSSSHFLCVYTTGYLSSYSANYSSGVGLSFEI